MNAELNYKSSNPKVSVCVVTYNQEKYIRQCLQSIIDQEVGFDFEVIVGDDFSTDGTTSIIREFESRYPGIFKPIYREKNIGAFRNFVDVHNCANGEYVAHIDGDDLMLSKKLCLQVKCLDDNPECTVVWHKVRCFNDDGCYSDDDYIDYEKIFPDGKVSFDDALAIGSIAANSSCMYRKTARLTTNPEFKVIDLFYTWEYLSTGWGKVLQDVLGQYRIASKGAISVNSSVLIRRLNAYYSRFFYKKFPEKRVQIFIFALTNFLIDVKNLRVTFIYFLLLAIETFSISGIIQMPMHIKRVKVFRIPVLHKR
jgi:glycosyltransferase involved in cell wall biosynthesis